MESSSAPSVADQSREIRVSHQSKISCKLPPLGLKTATGKNVALRHQPVGGATSARMLSNGARKAEAMRVQPSASFCTTSSCSSLRANRVNCGSRGASLQKELSQLQAPKVNYQGQLPDSKALILRASVKSVAEPSILRADIDEASVEKRPRTVEEALQLFDDAGEFDHSNLWSGQRKTAQTGVADTLEPGGVVEEEGGFLRTAKATGTALICNIETQKINYPSIRNTEPPFAIRTCVKQCTTIGPHTNSESEEKGAAEVPLTVELISNLTDDELYAEVQVLVARSMKLTTIEAERGACDWKNFTSLSVLSLSHNCLTDITPLSVLAPTLLDINVNFNCLNDLSPLFSCKRLQHLSAAHNHINSIAGIGCCRDIETLILFHNCLHGEFKQILEHVSTLPKLRELDIDGNPLLAPGNSGKESDRDVASSTSESCTGENEREVANRGLQYQSSFTKNKVVLRNLLAKCPSLRIFGGTDVQRLEYSVTSKADLLVDSMSPGSAVNEAAKQAKKSTPQAPVSASNGAKTTLSVTHRTTWTHKEGQSSVYKCDTSRANAEDPASEESPEKEEGSTEVESDSGELDDTASLEKLKKHVWMLRLENRNMYALLEENRELRRQVQYHNICSYPVSRSTFAARTQSAHPPSLLNLRNLSSAGPRPRIALFLDDNQTKTRESRCSPLGMRSLESRPFRDHIALNVSKEHVVSSGSSNSTSHQHCAVTERGKPSPRKSQSEVEDAPVDDRQQQISERDSVVHDESENQQTVAVLKWKNDMLKRRLDRMVEYVQLLREDLDQARFSCIHGNAAGPQGNHSGEDFRPPKIQPTTHRVLVKSHLERVEGQADCAGVRRNTEKLGQAIASTETPMKDIYSSKHDTLDTNESGLEDSPSSSSSTSEILEDPPSPTAKSVVTERELGQHQSKITPSYACYPAENDATGKSQIASEVGTCSSSGGVPAGAVFPAYATRSGDCSGLQLTQRREDKGVTDLLERSTEDLKARRREERDTEWNPSRSTSACSCITQITSRAAALLNVPARQGEERSEDAASRDVTSKSGMQQIAQHCSSQESFPSARRIYLENSFPSPLIAKDQEKKNRADQKMKPVSKQASVKRRPYGYQQQQARESATNAGATIGALLFEYSGGSFSTHQQKPVAKPAREEAGARQHSRQPAEASLLSSALTKNSTLTVTRSRCSKATSLGVYASGSSRQPLSKTILPPLPKRTNLVKGDLE